MNMRIASTESSAISETFVGKHPTRCRGRRLRLEVTRTSLKAVLAANQLTMKLLCIYARHWQACAPLRQRRITNINISKGWRERRKEREQQRTCHVKPYDRRSRRTIRTQP